MPAVVASQGKAVLRPKRPSATDLQCEEELIGRIDFLHMEMLYLGVRKLVQKLQEEGYPVGRKLVRRLMDSIGIHAIYQKENFSNRNFKEAVVPYLLRNKRVFLPCQVWCIDITYIKMQHGHMYLIAIIDWYSRMIVGWNLSDTLDTGSVIQAVKDAVAEYGMPGILNSDQGCQFTSKEYKVVLKDFRITQSMDGKSS